MNNIKDIILRSKLLMEYNLYETYDENLSRVIKENEEQEIADILYKQYIRDGTDEEPLTSAIERIKDSAQFWNINSYLISKGNTKTHKGPSIEKVINSELGGYDTQYIMRISNHLKQNLGMDNTYDDNGFKILSAGPTPTPTTTTDSGSVYDSVPGAYNSVPSAYDSVPGSQTSTNQTTYTKPDELKDVKLFHSWLDAKHPNWHSKYKPTLGNNPSKGYGKYGPNTQRAWGLYKDEYLKWVNEGGTFETLKQQ